MQIRIISVSMKKIVGPIVPAKKTVLLVAVIAVILLVVLLKPARQESSTPGDAQAAAAVPRSEAVPGSMAPQKRPTRPVAPAAVIPANEAPLAEQLPKLRALSASGNVEASCKLSALLEDCAANASRRRSLLSRAARQRARARLGSKDASSGFTSGYDTNELATRAAACNESAPDFYAERAEMLLAQAKQNQPLAILGLIRMSQESLVALAIDRPDLLKEMTEQINQHVLNPGEWLAFSQDGDLVGLATAFGTTHMPASGWSAELFEPNQALGYLYLLLSTADQANELERYRRLGAQNAKPENREPGWKFHALIETEKQLTVAARDAMQTKAKQLYPMMQKVRGAHTRRQNLLKNRLDFNGPSGQRMQRLLECEQPI